MEHLFRHGRAGMNKVLLCLIFLLGTSAAALDPGERMPFADGLYVRGLYDMALEEYRRILREAPEYEHLDRVLFRFAECHRRLDQPDAAAGIYARLIREQPESDYRVRAEFRLAEMEVAAGRFPEAIRQFRAVLDRDPPEEMAASAWFYRGYAAGRLGLHDEAVHAFITVLEEHADSDFYSYAALELAGLYGDLEREPETRVDLYRRAADRPATPSIGAEALFQLGEASFLQRDYEAGARAYNQLLKSYPDEPRAREARLQAAWAFHHAGRYADGLRLAEEALGEAAERDQEAEWLYVMANCQRRLFRADDARETYARIIREHAGHELAPVSAYERALISFRQGDYAEAVRAAELAEPAEEIEQDLYWLLAESYAALDREDEAVSYYRRIMESFPGGERAPQAQYRMARLLQNREQYAEASRLYRELAGTHPDHELAAPSLFASAYGMAMDGRLDEALRDWGAVIESHPGHALAGESMIQKALALKQLQRDEEALTVLGAFLEVHPGSDFAAEAHYRRGVLYARADHPADAEESLRAALEQDPDGDLANRIQFRLALVLQSLDQESEAAGLLVSLLDTPARAHMPVALLEWLALHQLDARSFEHAAQAAERLVETAETAAWRQIGWSLAGRARIGAGRSEEARAAFERSVNEGARTREGAEAALYLGRLEREAGNHDRARTHLERAAEMASEAALADIRARAYFELGRVAAGREDWDAAVRYFMGVGILYDDPELVPESLYRAAKAFGTLGRDRERERTLEELRERYPESEWTKNGESE